MVRDSDSQPILIIDQDEVVRDSLKALLESHGFAVRSFRNADEFLGVAELPKGSCLILGFNRHIVEGLNLLRALRKRSADLPVIFIVGVGSNATKAAISAAGAFAYLERPIAESALVQTIRSAAAQHDQAEARSPALPGALPDPQ